MRSFLVPRYGFALRKPTHHLIALRNELVAGTYRPGAYTSFWIHEPKRRLISAAPFRDRVVHHALSNLVEPIFERTFAVPYPSLADTGGHAIAALQGVVPVQAVPTTVVLDREGRVAARILGLATPSTLRGLVDDILAEGAGTDRSARP